MFSQPDIEVQKKIQSELAPISLPSKSSLACNLIQSFEEHYEVLESFDNFSKFLKVRHLKTNQLRTAIFSTEQHDVVSIKRQIENFKQTKRFFESIKSSFYLDLIDIFVEKSSITEHSVEIVRIFEGIDTLTHSNQALNFYDFKPVFRPFELNQSDLIQILYDSVVLFKTLEDLGMSPILQNSLFVQTNKTHKILIQHVCVMTVENTNFHPIFGFEKSKEEIKGFTNKLEIQKSSFHTVESNDERHQNNKSNHNKVKNLKKSVLPYRFAVSSCFELFKSVLRQKYQSTCVNDDHLKTLVSEQKTTSFKKLFNFFDHLNAVTELDLKFGILEEVIHRIHNYLEVFCRVFFSFKNECLSILKKPVYKNATQLRMEITDDCKEVNKCIELLTSELSKNRNLVTLELHLSHISLGRVDLENLTDLISNLTTLKRFSFELLNNTISEKVIRLLSKIISDNKIEVLSIDFEQ